MLKVGGDVTTKYTKREEGYEDVIIKKYIGGTAACMKILAMATKGFGQLT